MKGFAGLENQIILLLFVFELIYAPPILPYLYIFLGIFLLFIFVWDRKTVSISLFYQKSGMKLWMHAMLLLFLYAVLIPIPVSFLCEDIVNAKHYYHLFNRFSVLVFMELTFGLYILMKAVRNGISYRKLLDIIFYAGILQSVFACLAFLIPSVKDVFLNLMMTMGGLSDDNMGFILNRTFGFAGTLVDVFGMGTGLIAGLAFYRGIRDHWKYIVYSMFILIPSMLNARTGVLIYAIAIGVTLLFIVFVRHRIKMLVKWLAVMLFIPSIFLASIQVMLETNPTTAMWLAMGVYSVQDYMETGSGNEDNMKIVTSDSFWKLPDDERIFIGTGHSRYEAEGYAHSDCGYVNDIWFVGFLGLILLYGVVFYLLYCIYRDARSDYDKFVSVFFFLSFCVFNIKAALIGYQPGGAVLFFVIFATRLYQNIDRKERKGCLNYGR